MGDPIGFHVDQRLLGSARKSKIWCGSLELLAPQDSAPVAMPARNWASLSTRYPN